MTHLVANIEDDQKLVRVHVCAHRRSDLGDLAFLIGSYDHLDLHCLNDEQGIARADILVDPDSDRAHHARHWGCDMSRIVGIRLAEHSMGFHQAAVGDLDGPRLPVELEIDAALAVLIGIPER